MKREELGARVGGIWQDYERLGRACRRQASAARRCWTSRLGRGHGLSARLLWGPRSARLTSGEGRETSETAFWTAAHLCSPFHGPRLAVDSFTVVGTGQPCVSTPPSNPSTGTYNTSPLPPTTTTTTTTTNQRSSTTNAAAAVKLDKLDAAARQPTPSPTASLKLKHCRQSTWGITCCMPPWLLSGLHGRSRMQPSHRPVVHEQHSKSWTWAAAANVPARRPWPRAL